MNSKFKIPYHVRRKTLSFRAGRMSRLPEGEVIFTDTTVLIIALSS